MKQTALLLLFCTFFIVVPEPTVAQEEESLQSLPAMVDQMNSLWQTFKEPLISPERATILADQIIALRHRAGMLSNTSLARAFGLRAWSQQQNGDLAAAERLYQHAIALDPYSRELRVGAASVRFALNPINPFDYIPAYIDAVLVSFQTHSGRYKLLNDLLILFGVMGVIFLAGWALYCLIVYLPLLHKSLQELLAIPFTLELAGPIALLFLGLPVALSPWLWISLLILFGLTWGFQSTTPRIISGVAIVLVMLGLAAIETANYMALTGAQPKVQAAFTAETYDASHASIAAMKNQLETEGIITSDGIASDLTDRQRMQLYLYGIGVRKMGLGPSQSVNLENLFQLLSGSDSIGLRSRVVWGTIRIEKDDLRAGTQAYQSVLRSNDYAEAFALYNLARLNYFLGNTGQAQQYFDTLKESFTRHVGKFNIDNIDLRPQFIDPSLRDQEIADIIAASMARASGSTSPVRTLELFIFSISQHQAIWLLGVVLVALVSWLAFRSFGISRYCTSCGKRYSKHQDLDPLSSKICQSCNSLKALQATVDARLRREQENRIKAHRSGKRLMDIITLAVFPFAIPARRGQTLVALGILTLWSLALALVFTLDKMPRLEALPYFSHWSALSLTLTALLLLGAYLWAGFTFVALRREKHGIER